MSTLFAGTEQALHYVGRSRRIRLWALAVLSVVGLFVLQAAFPGWWPLPSIGSQLTTVTLLIVFFTALVCEYIDSALGMGYGTTLTPLLLLAGFEPLQIVPAVLFSECLTGLAAGLLHHRDGNIDFLRDRRAIGTVVLLSSLSAIGAIVAVTIALQVPKVWLSGIIAVIILSVGVVILATIRRQLRYRSGHIIAVGAVAAFNKGLSGGGYGPLVTGGQVVSGLPAKHAVAITSLAESLTCLVALGAYYVGLKNGSIYWPLAMPLTLGALLSVPLATVTVRVLPEPLMRGSVGVLTCILGVVTMVKTFC